MYWIHRIGRGEDGLYALHFDALWDLLDQKNILTIGWQCFVNDQNMVDFVETNNSDGIRDGMIRAGIDDSKKREGLINFAKMTAGDIVLVLPIPEYEPRFFVVEIQSSHAKSILKIQQQSSYTTKILAPSGRKINFDPSLGFVYSDHSPVDVGFFHEVKILKRIQRSQMHPALKIVCDNVISTNQLITKTSIQNLIPQ